MHCSNHQFYSITSSTRASRVCGTVRPKGLDGGRVDDEIEFSGLLDRDVGGLRTPQNRPFRRRAKDISGRSGPLDIVGAVQSGGYSVFLPTRRQSTRPRCARRVRDLRVGGGTIFYKAAMNVTLVRSYVIFRRSRIRDRPPGTRGG
jgi:hypothetical protein